MEQFRLDIELESSQPQFREKPPLMPAKGIKHRSFLVELITYILTKYMPVKFVQPCLDSTPVELDLLNPTFKDVRQEYELHISLK